MENKTKILFLGDRSVGKTSFLITYITNRFPEDFVPSTDENFEGNINFNGKELSLGFWDFGSRGDDPEGDRPLHYPDIGSLGRIKRTFIPEIQKYCPGVPFIIVGNKIDLREDEEELKKLSLKGLTPISYKYGENFAKEVGAYSYVESSAKLNIGLVETIKKTADAIQNPYSNEFSSKQSDCILL